MGGYWTGSFVSFFFLREVYAILQSDVRHIISILHSSLCIFSKFFSGNETTCHYKVEIGTPPHACPLDATCHLYKEMDALTIILMD